MWLEFTPPPNCKYQKGQLKVCNVYNTGNLLTDSKSLISVLRPIPNTSKIFLYSTDKKILVQSFESINEAMSELMISDENIILGYNCHGFTFGNSQYWINDDQVEIILDGDSYELTGRENANIAIFLKNKKIIHSCTIDLISNELIGKAGVRGFIKTLFTKKASQNNSYDSILFYKKDF